MRRAGWIVAWVVATAVVSFVTLHTLSLAEAGIGEGDLSPVVVASSPVETTPESVDTVEGDPTSPVQIPRDDAPESTTTTTIVPTSAASSPPASLTTAAPSSTTTVTVAVPTWETRTVESGGGTVTVRVAPSTVEFVSAFPAPGFIVEIDDDGPTRVRVEFESEAERYEVRIEWDGSELLISTD